MGGCPLPIDGCRCSGGAAGRPCTGPGPTPLAGPCGVGGGNGINGCGFCCCVLVLAGGTKRLLRNCSRSSGGSCSCPWPCVGLCEDVIMFYLSLCSSLFFAAMLSSVNSFFPVAGPLNVAIYS